MRMGVQSLAFLSGLRIQCCHEMWCRLAKWLGSSVAVACGHTLAAIGPIQPLAWKCPYAIDVALKRKKKSYFYVYSLYY